MSIINVPSDHDRSGRSFGAEELNLLGEVIESGVLFGLDGPMTGRLEQEFAEFCGSRFALACSSGTAAVHAALAVQDFAAGSEVIVSPVTDIGGVAPLLHLGLTPAFADVEPRTGNMTAESVRSLIGPKTVAIVVTHLAGDPADMDALSEVAALHNLVLIEDCAQAFGARYNGQLVGTFGSVGCFSTQQGKHISSGEGGLLITDDPETYRRLRSWINKGLSFGEPIEDHGILGWNARLSELQAAVALAQLRKLDGFLSARGSTAERMTAALTGAQHIQLPPLDPRRFSTYWKYLVFVDSAVPDGRERLADRLRPWGALVSPRYILRPSYANSLFRRFPRRLLGSGTPAVLTNTRADDTDYPGMRSFADDVVVLQWNEKIATSHVDALAAAIRSFSESV